MCTPRHVERRGRPRSRAAAITRALALLAAACGGGGADPVRQVLDDVVEAAEERSAEGVERQLSARFTAGGLDRAGALAELRRYFAAYESLGVELTDVTIERGEAEAHARFVADLSGRTRKLPALDGLLPSAASFDFDVRLEREGDGWRIVRADWEPLTLQEP
jgi:hypothetical protein